MSALVDQLVEQHMHMVHSIAATLRRRLGRTMEHGDLIGYGTQGLIEAAKKYDPRRGSFEAFAHYRIRGAIIDGMRRMGWYSRNDCIRFRAEERTQAYLAAVAEREAAEKAADPSAPTKDKGEILEDIAEILGGLTAVHIATIEAARHLPDEKFKAPDQELEDAEVSERVRLAIERLPEKERQLLEHYYFADENLETAGKKLGLSKSWASRLHARAIDYLRNILEAINQ
jgi:RNA polymerase sigma factor for flagellar operon FliA